MIRRIFILVCSISICLGAIAESAPRLSLKDLSGHTQKLSSLRGRIVVLNFWATWCGPCQQELPRLSALAQQYAGRNVQFIAASIDEAKDRGKIEPLLQRLNVDIDIWTGADLDTLGKFGLGNIVPGTIIMDEKGEIITRIMGEARTVDVSTPVEWLLGNRTSPAPQALIRRY